MAELQAFKVDAFTDRAYAGNGAGVVPDANGLSDAQMQAIAREMNLSETAFVLRPAAEGADVRLRYFTPASEVPLCGHATIAAFHLLAELGRIASPSRLRVETGAGVLPVDVREDGRVFLTAGPLSYHPSPAAPDALASLLGVPQDELLAEPAPMLIQGKLFVPVRGLKTLETMRPDFPRIRALAQHGVQGVAPLSFETRSPESLTHIRYFAPAVGIDEDPVTGTAHMGLAGYLLGAARMRTKCVFIGEQGDFCGRPGRVEVEVMGTQEAPIIRVGGRAVTVMRGSLVVPG